MSVISFSTVQFTYYYWEILSNMEFEANLFKGSFHHPTVCHFSTLEKKSVGHKFNPQCSGKLVNELNKIESI